MGDPDKVRVPFAIRKKTKKQLEELRREIRKKTGEDINFPDLTHEIVLKANINDILKGDIDIRLNLDRRKR